MADQARKQTDKILSDMEKEVDAIYSRASKEISEKWDKYMESHKGKVTSAYNDLQSALASGDAQAIREAKSVYERTVKNVTLNNDRYKAMVKETTAKLSHTNEVALDYVNGNMAKIYTLNYNEFANQDISGYSFTLVNEQAVKNLAKEDKSLLPKKKVDIPKDKAWNTKSINAEVLQGILQGENIPKIAKRLTHVTDMNKNSSIRNARTMVTGAENKGRQDSFKKAQSDGVIMVRRWVATNDDRTREAHAELDGQEVGIDEPWENEYGEIMYPGDPAADPANVYNCRCSIRSIVQGFKWDEASEEVSDEKIKVVQGKDLSKTWIRRPDKFDFEIEDVINAQGFDGLPRVVSSDEFDRYVQESNFIAQRTYSAPDQETLDAYRDQLYNGKWYVDCSVGESHYGQGMYGTGTSGNSVNDSIKNTMNKYIEINTDRITDYGDLKIDVKSAVETFTVTPDAKFISHDDLRRLKEKEITELSSSGSYDKMNKIFNMDNGSYATIKGYDGITGVYNFVSKENNDVIILNRTKVIFKKE